MPPVSVTWQARKFAFCAVAGAASLGFSPQPAAAKAIRASTAKVR
jgi:hypothetical protein